MESFSTDYTQTRAKSIDEARSQDAQLECFPQGRHADGLCYDGDAPDWSCRVLTEALRSRFGSAARIAIVDFHTGMGTYSYAGPIIYRHRDVFLEAPRMACHTFAPVKKHNRAMRGATPQRLPGAARANGAR